MYSYEELEGIRWLSERIIEAYYKLFGTWEKREKAKNIFCWCLIVFIALTPFLAKPKVKNNYNSIHDSSDFENIIIEEEISETRSINDIIFTAVRTWIPDYTIYKTNVRDYNIYVRLFNENWYKYDDLVKLGNYLKSAYPDYKIYIIFVKYYDPNYAVIDYKL